MNKVPLVTMIPSPNPINKPPSQMTTNSIARKTGASENNFEDGNNSDPISQHEGNRITLFYSTSF